MTDKQQNKLYFNLQSRKGNNVEKAFILSYRGILGGLLATYVSFLAIKVFNPKLMDTITNSSKVAGFLFSKKFVLGIGIALMAVLFLAKLVSAFMCVVLCSGANEAHKKDSRVEHQITTKDHLCMWPQVIGGIVISTSSIVLMSLMLANKISPEKTALMEKIFLGGFGGAIGIALIVGLVILIAGLIINNNKSLDTTQAQPHNNRLNTFAQIFDAITGMFSFSVIGTLPWHEVESIQLKDNHIGRTDEVVTINFLSVLQIEFAGKSIT